MRFVRRAPLIFSLVLIGAIVVGYVARTSELTRTRDRSLAAAAEIGAARLGSILDGIEVAAGASNGSGAAAEALASIYPDLGICVATAERWNCVGSGPTPAAKDVAEAVRLRANRDAGDLATRLRTLQVVAYDSQLWIEAQGPTATLLVGAPSDIINYRDRDERLFATTLLPSEVSVGEFTVDRGVRQTSAGVARAESAVPIVYVVATIEAAVNLPSHEFRFQLVIFVLSLALMALAGVTMVIEQRNLVERASFDPLTKLPNRSEFERRAADIIAEGRTGESACLLLFDLNDFKQVNDTYGHVAGDELLKVIGRRLDKSVRDHDVVARWGGDEFVVMMPGIDSEDMGAKRALELAEQISGRTRIQGISDALRVKVSVGVALWPQHGERLDDLVIAADQAMYEAKREGVICRVAVPSASTAPATISSG